MLGSVFLSVNDMITKIRYEYNLAVVDKERQGIRRQENSVYKRRDTEELCPHQPIVQWLNTVKHKLALAVCVCVWNL